MPLARPVAVQEVAVDVAAVVQPAALAKGPVELVETWTS